MIRQGQPELVDITEITVSSADTGGSMISSARDLSEFLAALLAEKLVPAPLLDQMLEPSDKGTLLGFAGYGLGIMTLQLPEECGGRTVYGSGAGILGYAGMAFGTRDGQRRVAVSFNTASNDALRATQKLVGITQLVFCGRQATPAPTATPASAG